ncbi:MAG: hypothetical protein QXX03_05635 [Nitrososphaerota archaeon]
MKGQITGTKLERILSESGFHLRVITEPRVYRGDISYKLTELEDLINKGILVPKNEVIKQALIMISKGEVEIIPPYPEEMYLGRKIRRTFILGPRFGIPRYPPGEIRPPEVPVLPIIPVPIRPLPPKEIITPTQKEGVTPASYIETIEEMYER